MPSPRVGSPIRSRSALDTPRVMNWSIRADSSNETSAPYWARVTWQAAFTTSFKTVPGSKELARRVPTLQRSPTSGLSAFRVGLMTSFCPSEPNGLSPLCPSVWRLSYTTASSEAGIDRLVQICRRCASNCHVSTYPGDALSARTGPDAGSFFGERLLEASAEPLKGEALVADYSLPEREMRVAALEDGSRFLPSLLADGVG